MAQYAVLVTYREVLGKEPELAHLHALLGKYQRKEVLFLLAKLNCLLGTWQNALDFEVDIKLTRILLSSYYSQIDKLRRASGGRVLFSRITLLYLAKQAEGQRLLVFEQKSSTIRADCKYGGDVSKLKAELHLKFIDGDDEGTKGIAQLNKSMIRFLSGESMDGIACSDVTKIYPCLICLDNSVSVP